MPPLGPTGDRLTAVVLTYDRRDLLDTVLPSLDAQSWPDLRVVVVDNGSADGSAEHVRARWPHFEVLRLERNVGVAAALNRGVEACASEYVALLNNDLELRPDYLARLVATLDRHPGAASAAGKMLSFHDRDRFDGAGDLFRWSGVATHRGYGEPDTGQFDEPAEVFSPCAGAAVFRRRCFDEVGPFDEDFFAYLEDVDWGLRAQLAGWSARYDPEAVCFHMGGATTAGDGPRYNRLLRRNGLWLVAKDYPARALVLHAPKLLAHHGGWLATAARERRLGEELSMLAEAARGLPRMLRKRRAVQAGRRVPLTRLDAVISPELHAGQPLGRRAASIGSELVRALRGR